MFGVHVGIGERCVDALRALRPLPSMHQEYDLKVDKMSSLQVGTDDYFASGCKRRGIQGVEGGKWDANSLKFQDKFIMICLFLVFFIKLSLKS